MAIESTAEVPAEVLTYLREHTTLTLATASPSGVPHAATMVYVNDGPVLYFCTRPDTTSVSHIEQNPAVAFTIDDPSADWRTMKGIQGTGEAYVLLSSVSISEVTALFKEKYSDLNDLGTRNISIFRISPNSVEYLDNARSGAGDGLKSLAEDWQSTVVFNIFRGLPERQFEEVLGKLDTVQVEAGHIVVRQGTPADKFYIIANGEVEVIREDNGQSRRVATLQSGQYFGEMAVLHDLPRTATVKALVPSTLLAMPGNVFRGLVAQSLSTSADFDKVMRQRFAELGQSPGV